MGIGKIHILYLI